MNGDDKGNPPAGPGAKNAAASPPGSPPAGPGAGSPAGPGAGSPAGPAGAAPTRPPARGRGGKRLALILGAVGLGLVIVLVGLLAFAESWANHQKDRVLADLSKQLGREVTAGAIDIGLFGDLRFGIQDVRIGRDPANPKEPDPAFVLERLTFRMPLWPVIRHLGRFAWIRELSVDGLVVEVVRFPDGHLNWQDVAKKLTGPAKPQQETPAEPLDPATRAAIRGIKVASLRISDARFGLTDLEKGGAALAITDFDVEADNATLGAPFELGISAAVLTKEKNFSLRANFLEAPFLEEGIAPPPLERVVVALRPTSLAPLGPFLESAGLAGFADVTEGRLGMDLDAAVGAALPGGQGPSHLKGNVTLDKVRFDKGEVFDARLDSDVSADVPAGSVDIQRFSAALGEMALEASGRVANLAQKPTVAGFSLRSRGLDFSRMRAYYPALDRTAGVFLRGPFEVSADGKHVEGTERLTARLDLRNASVEIPNEFRKAAGTPLSLEVQVAARENLIQLEQALLTMAKWTIRSSGSLRSSSEGENVRRSFTAKVDAPPVPVRELLALLAPQMLEGLPPARVGATVLAKGTVGRPATFDVEVSQFSATSGRSDLAGRVQLSNLESPRLTLAARSRYLDLDDFVPASPDGEAPDAGKADASAKGKGGGPADSEKEEPPPILKKLVGQIDLAVASGRAANIEYSALRADLGIKNGRLSAKALEVNTFGGHFSGAGTELPLLSDSEPFKARGEVSGLDVAAVLSHFSKKPPFLLGKLTGKLDLAGAGTKPDVLTSTLSGKLSGKVLEGELLTTTLLGPVVAALEKAADAPVVGRFLATQTDRAKKLVRDRRLQRLAGVVFFADGAAEIADPLTADTPSGPLSIDGRVGLDGQANMIAKLELSAEVANALIGGKGRFEGPIPIELLVEGPLSKPRVRPGNPAELAKVFVAALVRGQGAQVLRDKATAIIDKAGGQRAREQVEGAVQQAQQAREEATRRGEEARARAEAEARAAAEAQRQRAEREAAQAKERAKQEASKKLKGLFGK